MALLVVEAIETVDKAQRAQTAATTEAMGGAARTRFVMRRLRSRSAPSTKQEAKLPATAARSYWCCHRYRRVDLLVWPSLRVASQCSHRVASMSGQSRVQPTQTRDCC